MEQNKVQKCINPNEYGSLLFDEKETNAVVNVMNARRIFRYSRTECAYANEFEEMINSKFGSKFCLGIVNGTAGLVTALQGIGIEQGDRVLVSSFTYISTALAVKLAGGVPVPLEIDLETGVDMADLEAELKKGCKAVIVTHLQGRCFDLSSLAKMLKEKNIFLIEDACQGFAAHCGGKYAGTYGDVGVYSFQQFKQISSGEGGAIVTNDEKIYTRARNYSDMGSVRDRFPNWNDETCLFGENYRISQLTSAILVEQMKKLDLMLEKQQSSRTRILSAVSGDIKSILNSKDSSGDTGMNIVLFAKSPEIRDEIIKISKELFNVEVRKMWSGLYFDNKLFKDNHLTDIDLKGYELSKSKDIVSKMIVLSVPPTLSVENEQTMIENLLYLKKENYID